MFNAIKPVQNLENIIENIGSKYSILTNSCKLDFINSAKIITANKSTIIVNEGQNADKLYFVINGSFRVFYFKDGKDVTDWFAFENDFVCSINSFFLSIPSPHYVQTLSSTTYLEISREQTFKLMEKHHCFETLARKAITQIMLQLQNRIVSLQFETAQQKYDSLVNIRPDITQRVPLIHIASYLGITIETLSRIRNPKNRI